MCQLSSWKLTAWISRPCCLTRSKGRCNVRQWAGISRAVVGNDGKVNSDSLERQLQLDGLRAPCLLAKLGLKIDGVTVVV